jgi:hypothetical protein
LIVIEHAFAAGIPWHVAASAHWSCSYSSSWISLLQGLQTQHSGEEHAAVAVIPEALEIPAMIRAMETSARRTADFAASLGMPCDVEIGAGCDLKRLKGMLETASVMKVICHGFVDPGAREVAWLLGSQGELPVAAAVATNHRVGEASRFSWRDANRLECAPSTVFSAACSSGSNYLTGVGERLGFMGALRRVGTRAFVAPKWDVVAEIVLPILDDAMELYWAHRHLGASVRTACLRAPENTPRWLRWAISLEGDWR